MIQKKTPKKVKGARKKRRAKEKQGQIEAMDYIKESFRKTIDRKIQVELIKGVAGKQNS